MKIFQVNDIDWFAGENADDCFKLLKEMGMYDDGDIQAMKDDGYPVELTDEDMDRLVFVDDVYDNLKSNKRTFREELQRRINAGEEFPCMFASSEY